MKQNAMLNFLVLERLYIKGTVLADQNIMSDILAKLIQSNPKLPLTHLSIRACVNEDSLLYTL
jgi:hypothetical protein